MPSLSGPQIRVLRAVITSIFLLVLPACGVYAQQPDSYGTYIVAGNTIWSVGDFSLNPPGLPTSHVTVVESRDWQFFDGSSGSEKLPDPSDPTYSSDVALVSPTAGFIVFQNSTSHTSGDIAASFRITREPFIRKFEASGHPINVWLVLSGIPNLDGGISATPVKFRTKPMNQNETIVAIIPTTSLLPGLYSVTSNWQSFYFVVSATAGDSSQPCYNAAAVATQSGIYTFYSARYDSC